MVWAVVVFNTSLYLDLVIARRALSHAIGALIARCAVCTDPERAVTCGVPQIDDEGQRQLLLEFANGIEAISRP